MIDLDDAIRQTVYEWAESAPMAPSLEHLEGSTPVGGRAAPRATVLVTAAIGVAVLLVAVAVSVRHSRPQPSIVQSIPAPSPATFDDVAGQTLAARFGVPAPTEYFQLAGEWGRTSPSPRVTATSRRDRSAPSTPSSRARRRRLRLQLRGRDGAADRAGRRRRRRDRSRRRRGRDGGGHGATYVQHGAATTPTR